MIIATGGAGFIGSNLVKGLNDLGKTDILVVDDLSQGDKFKNLLALDVKDYVDQGDFMDKLLQGKYDNAGIDAVFHNGACSDTMEYNGKYMLNNNYEYSKDLLQFCLRKRIPFIYASSASVYGSGLRGFQVTPECEWALNVYAFSKLFFDRYVRRVLPVAESQIVGLRYFNVFGPQENHKGKMASVTYQFFRQLKTDGVVKLFAGVDGYADGEQKRDFIYVKDVVAINLFFYKNSAKRGIFNCGTGRASSFNELANALLTSAGGGEIKYVEFPTTLKGKYQNFTQADMSWLEDEGCSHRFASLTEAVGEYYRCLMENDGYLS